MSDTCANRLEVTGSAELITHFRQANAGRLSKGDGTLVDIPLSFDALVPMPPVLSNPPVGWERPYSHLMDPYMDLLDADAPLAAAAERIAAARARLAAGGDVDPVERQVLEREAACGVAHWYPWRLLHWGVKSDLDDATGLSAREPDRLVYTFDTPWAPPEAWLAAVAARYPDLRFVLAYAETSDAFGGFRVLEGGKVVATHYVEPEVPEDEDEAETDWDEERPPLFDAVSDAAPWTRR
jgi:hypothetical protein